MDEMRRGQQNKTQQKNATGLSKQKTKPAYRTGNAAFYQAVALVVFATVGWLIYSNTLKSPFLFDDRAHIQENPHIRLTKLALKDVLAAGFKSPSAHRPVANISFALNYYFHRYNVIGYHYTNIIIHILTAIFLYLFVKNTLRIPPLRCRYQSYPWIPFFAALLWLVHPLQTQSVNYIVQRMNSLAAMFYILSFLLYAKARLAGQSHKKTWPWFAGCVLAGILAFGCKEMTATLPLFILLYEWYFFQDLSGRWLRYYLPYVIAVVVISALVGLWYLGANPMEKILSSYDRREFTLTERLMTQPRVVIYYISLLAYPHPTRLNLDHYFGISGSFTAPLTTIPCIAAIIALIATAFYTAKKQRLLSFSILWFLGNLVIESSVIGLEIIFEHRLYLPSMFVAVAIVALACRRFKRNALCTAILCIVTILCCAFTYERNHVWTDPLTLWKDCADKSPKKPRPHYNLARSLYQHGRIDEAIEYYNKTLQIKPNHANAHVNLGLALLDKGNVNEAINYSSRALQLDPNSSRAHCNIGIALHQQGKFDKAIEHYNQALRINPEFPEVYNNLAMLFYQQGSSSRAITHWLEAIRLKPDWPEVLNNLAWPMATHKDAQYYDPHEALQLAKKTCELTEYKKPDFLDTLAAAYAATGEFKRAIETAETALKFATVTAKQPLIQEIRKRIQLYKTGQPYHESRSLSQPSLKTEHPIPTTAENP